MARIKGKNTGPERLLGRELTRYGLHWDKHAKDLPGRPDFVFRKRRVVVFVDGDFWHGWRLPAWLDKLAAKWAEKITGNRERDRRIHRSLRRSGWCVLRIWEHQIERDLQACVKRVVKATELRITDKIRGAQPGRKRRNLV
jgi:DNA mismatch endonuclease (patch repair protein)